MRIKRKSWHHRVYQGWLWRKEVGIFGFGKVYSRPTLDLCHYMRVVLIFAWVRLVLQGWTYRAARFPELDAWAPPRPRPRWPWYRALWILTSPFAFVPVAAALGAVGYSLWAWPEIWARMVVMLVAFVLVTFASFLLIDRKGERIGGVVASGTSRVWQHRPHPVRAARESLLWQWLKARKRRICPILEVVDDDGR